MALESLISSAMVVYDQFTDFFNGVDWPLVAFICTVSLAGVVVLFIIGMLIKAKSDSQKYALSLSYQSATVRVFEIDAARDVVRYFNISNMSKVKSTPIAGFYASFPITEQARVREWISALLEGRAAPNYLQTDVYFKKDKRVVPSFLKVYKASPKRGVLHIESHLLKFDKPMKTLKRSFSTEGDFAQSLKANGSATGMTFCFSLRRRNERGQTVMPINKASFLSPELAYRYKEAINSYAIGNQRLIQESPSELVIANFDMVDSSQAIAFALRVKEGAEKAMQPNKRKGPRLLYEVNVGIVANKDLLGDSDAILVEARKAADEAAESSSSLTFFKKGNHDFSAADELHYRSEVDRIIYEKKLSFTYRPVYNVDRSRIFGYLGRALPVGTSFASIDELKNYAARAKDEKNLFAAIAKNLIPRYVHEHSEKTQKLFYPVKMSEKNLLIPFFEKYSPAKDANLVFLFKEDDIRTSLDKAGEESFLAIIASLHKMGFGVSIMMGNKTLALDASIYSVCDFFLVNFGEGDDTDMDTRIRSELHALVEKLLKYKKPIIGVNLMNWTALELVVGSGISFISSDAFAPYDSMFKPIGSKNLERIKAIRDHK